MRRRIFNYIVREIAKQPECMRLPRWAQVLRCMFFPLISLIYWGKKQNGYDLETDTWKIRGVTISGCYVDRITQVGVKVEVVKVKNGCVTLKDIEEES